MTSLDVIYSNVDDNEYQKKKVIKIQNKEVLRKPAYVNNINKKN